MRDYEELVERLRTGTYTVEELTNILPQIADVIEELCKENTGNKLRPCPFCGSHRIQINRIYYTNEAYLRCKDCGIEQSLYDSLDEAIEAWNRRVI